MSLKYKSCIYCDSIFDISTSIHICNIQNNQTRQDNQNNQDNQNSENSQKIDEVCSKNNDKYENMNNLSTSHPVICNDPPTNGDYSPILDMSAKDTNVNKRQKRNKSHSSQLPTIVPSNNELYDIILQLSRKCDNLQIEVNHLKSQFTTKLKRDISEYLQYDTRQKYTFLDWVKTFTITDEILTIIFETDLTEGIKKCIDDRLQLEGVFSIPIRVFKEKPDWIFVYTNEPIKNESDTNEHEEKVKCSPVEIRLGVDSKELLKTPRWRMVTKSDFFRIKEYISEKIIIKFYSWEKDNEPLMSHSKEKLDILTSYTLKIIGHGSKNVKERKNTELYKWFFSKVAVS